MGISLSMSLGCEIVENTLYNNRPDDNYEENDDPLSAYDLTFHEHEG